MKTSILTIAVVDDSVKWTTIAENHIKKIEGCFLLIKIHDGFSFVEWCNHHKQLPNIALIDVEMPKMDGVQLTDFLTDHFPRIKIIAISSHANREVVEDMIGCGALGYVSKLHEMRNLPLAIAEVANGYVYIDPVLQIKNINREELMEERKKQKKTLENLKLSLKQKEIIALYTTSAGQKEIATALSTSPKTIEKRVKTVSEILNVTNRQEFTLESFRKGFARLARIFKPSE
ncbi:MAG: response regulator transcription factor [Chitinophagaceae bacterium]|nr:response regulator transcription factor [Chitinophagaceae bacterium]